MQCHTNLKTFACKFVSFGFILTNNLVYFWACDGVYLLVYFLEIWRRLVWVCENLLFGRFGSPDILLLHQLKAQYLFVYELLLLGLFLCVCVCEKYMQLFRQFSLAWLSYVCVYGLLPNSLLLTMIVLCLCFSMLLEI